jgi:hypothetical protein
VYLPTYIRKEILLVHESSLVTEEEGTYFWCHESSLLIEEEGTYFWVHESFLVTEEEGSGIV